jgi:DNA-binding Lrp family transcriptional regulator
VRGRGVRGLTQVLEEKSQAKPEVPRIAPEVIAGGLVAMARRQFIRKGARSLTSLAPIATYIALAPYIGAAEACVAANGDGRARMAAAKGTIASKTQERHTKWTIQSMLGERWATADELATEIGVSKKRIVADLEELEKDGAVERIVPLDEAKPTEWANTKVFRLIDDENWASLTPEERRDFTESFIRIAIADLVRMQDEVSGRRLDEHYTHLKLDLDQEGWTEMMAIHRAAFEASQVTKAKSEKRIRETGGTVIPGRSVQVLFELPPKD